MYIMIIDQGIKQKTLYRKFWYIFLPLQAKDFFVQYLSRYLALTVHFTRVFPVKNWPVVSTEVDFNQIGFFVLLTLLLIH